MAMETDAARASHKRAKEVSSSGSEEGGGVVTSEKWQEWEQVRHRRKKGQANKSGGGKLLAKGGVPPGARSGVSLGNPFSVLSSSDSEGEEEV